MSPPSSRLRERKKKEEKNIEYSKTRKRLASGATDSSLDELGNLSVTPMTPKVSTTLMTPKVPKFNMEQDLSPSAPPTYSDAAGIPGPPRKSRSLYTDSISPRSREPLRSTPRSLRNIGRRLSFDTADEGQMDEELGENVSATYGRMSVSHQRRQGGSRRPARNSDYDDPDYEQSQDKDKVLNLSKVQLEQKERQNALNAFLETCGQTSRCNYTLGKSRVIEGPAPAGVGRRTQRDVFNVIDDAQVAILDTISFNKSDHANIYKKYTESERIRKRFNTIVQPTNVRDIIK